MFKIRNPELDNVGTPFLLLKKITFIRSSNFCIGVTQRSKSGFTDLVGDQPSAPLLAFLASFLAKLVLSMGWPAGSLGKLKVHSETHRAALASIIFDFLQHFQLFGSF